MKAPGRVTEIVESASGDKPSEDVAGFRQVGARLHLWVIDGATAVAGTPPVMRGDMTDPAWFSRSLSAAMHREAGQGPLTPARLSRALGPIRDAFARKAPEDLDLSAWPQAAMIYLCASPARRGLVLEGLAYQDCFFDLRRPSGAAVPPPPPPSPTTAWPALAGSTGLEAERAGGRAPMMARRRAMLRGEDGTAISIFPQSALRGRRFRMELDGPRVLHLGSDGFARFWEEYALETQDTEMDRTLRRGALRELCRLRAWEAAHEGHGLAPKPVDDVTLMRVDLDPRGLSRQPLVSRRRGRTRHRAAQARWSRALSASSATKS